MYRKSLWLMLQQANSPECEAAGDQHPLGGGATEEQLWQISADSPGNRGGEEQGV